MTTLTRTCHFCQTEVPLKEACPTCLAAFPNRRPVHAMSGDERAAELELWGGVLEIPFSLVHERIEELVGRSVWTHELGLNWPCLVEEARTQDRPGMDAILDLIPEEKRVVVEVPR